MAAAQPKARQPIEAKAQAAGLAGTVAGVVIWALSTWAFKGSTIPPGLVSLIYAAVPGLLALAGAYLAPHTPRPAAVPPPVGPPSNIQVVPNITLPAGQDPGEVAAALTERMRQEPLQ